MSHMTQNYQRFGRCRLAAAVILGCGYMAAPTFVQAQGAAQLEEVIVMATRREASMQTVGISVSAVSGDAMRDFAIRDANELSGFVPGFSFTDTGSPIVGLISIRGVSQNDFAGHLEAPNTFYIDDVYLSGISATSQQFFDVSRVEVLKGPQGTLFGRNATGGLLHVITNKPTDELEGYAVVNIAERNQRKFEGAISGPISEGVRGRAAVFRNKVDGYFKNAIGPDLNEQDIIAGRGHLDIAPSDDWSLLLTADYYKLRPSTTGGGFVTPGTPNEDGLGVPLPPGTPTAYGYVDADGNPFTGAFDEPGRVAKEIRRLAANFSYDFGPVSLLSVTGYSDVETDYLEDNDLSPVPFTTFDQRTDSRDFSQELRLVGSTERVNWTAGIYYLNIDGDYGQGYTVLVADTDSRADYSLKTESWSVFGQADFELSPQLSLSTGLRWTRDERKFEYLRTCVGPACGDFSAPGTIGTAGLLRDKHDDDGWSARLQLDWTPVDDLLLYASVNRGYKAFNYNAGFAGLAPVEGLRFAGEQLMAYEIGSKLDFLDGRARLNTSAFYYDYKDYQAFDQRGVNFTLYNTDARIYGADAELLLRPAQYTTLQASLALLNTKVEDVPIGDRLENREATQSPKRTFSVAATQEIPLPVGMVRIVANAIYTGAFYSQLSNAPVTRIPSNWLVNGRMSWFNRDDSLELAIFAKNLLDENRQIFAFDITNIGLVENSFAEPRQVGVEARYRF